MNNALVRFGPAASLGVQRRALVPVSLPNCMRTTRRVAPKPALAALVTPVADDDKEQSLKYRRVVFDFDRWQTHRNQDRSKRHLVSMLSSRIVRSLFLPVMSVGSIAALLCTYDELLLSGALDGLPMLPTPSNVDVPISLASSSLALLLAYRTSASYQRFDEARKAWGLCVNRCRDLVRQGISWMDPVADAAQMAALARWVTVLPWSMLVHLRKGEDLGVAMARDIPEVSPHALTEAEQAYLLAAAHRPNTVYEAVSAIIWSTSMTQGRKHSMDKNLTAFSDVIGGCERLLRTPIPLAYTGHTSRFMMLWLGFLPFAMHNKTGLATVPTCMVISFFLLGIEEIGVNIEEPFSVLPLEAISATISKNVAEHFAHDAAVGMVRQQATWDGPESPWDDAEPSRIERPSGA